MKDVNLLLGHPTQQEVSRKFVSMVVNSAKLCCHWLKLTEGQNLNHTTICWKAKRKLNGLVLNSLTSISFLLLGQASTSSKSELSQGDGKMQTKNFDCPVGNLTG